MGNSLQCSACAVVTALALSSGVFLCPAQEPPPDVPPPATAPAPAPLEKPAAEPRVITAAETTAPKVTDTRLREVQFEGTPFEQVISQLRDATEANMVVVWKHIEQAGIDRKTPVQLHLRNVSLSKVLDEVFRQISADPTNRLFYTDDDGVITISTQAELSNNVDTRLYDMADLAADGADPDTDISEGLDDIADLIFNTVEVNTWDIAGGTGTIRPVYPRGRLLITQTPEVHRKIEALLRTLRRPSPQFTVDLCLMQFDPFALPTSLQRTLNGSDGEEGKSIGEQEKQTLLQAAKFATTTFPSLHAISGHCARLRSGTDIRYVANNDGNTASLTDGTTISVRPSVAPDGGPTTLAVQYTLAHLEKMEQVSVRPDPESTHTTTVQLPRVAIAEISATVAVEDGKSAVIAVSEPDSSSGVKVQRATGRRTYLLLTPHQHLPAEAHSAD